MPCCRRRPRPIGYNPLVDELLNKLAHWKPIRALVVGDFMLDQLVYGDAERLTNDAPVPVLTARRTVETPGGAANVCMDLVAMHAEVRCFGVMGDDREADLLSKALADSAIDTAGLVRDPSRPTTVKRNLIGLAQHRHPQKMFRVDFESRQPLADDVVDRIVEAFTAALPEADVVAIEDYNKGVCCPNLCRRVIEAAREAGKPILIDPASIDDYARYTGCTAITPNRTEAERATGLTTLTEGNTDERAAHNAALAKRLASQLDCEAVVLTLDRDGALLLERDAEPCAVPTIARQVYDVTGAGDMVLAALMAARANGIDWADSVRFANAAAGLEVEVFGVQPIPFERIYHAVLVQAKDLIGKRRTLDEARIEIEAARREGKKIVFTNGCFDIIHAGHISLLRKAREHGDLLVVGLNSDASVQRLKGPERPVHDEDDRVTVLSELESVAVVVVFEDDTPLKLIETLRPDVLVKGADYTKDQVVGGDIVESYGGEIALVDLLAGRSTTGAIERIRSV